MDPRDNQLIQLYFNEALESQKDVVKFGVFEAAPLNYFKKLKAKRAISYFEKVLEYTPEDFRLHFFIGKNYQSLKDFDKALSYLEKSVELNKEESLLPYETSIVALHLGLMEKAINYSEIAINRDPENATLLATNALYLLIAGNITESQVIINRAHQISPRDNFVINLKVDIDAVRMGHLTQPSLSDLLYK